MVSGKLLSVHPQNLQFPFELKKKISCIVQLTNYTGKYVAFKVKTTTPENYFVQPTVGVVMPDTTVNLSVTMLAQREAPADMQCKDEFLIQSAITTLKSAVNCEKDITSIHDMFNKGSANIVVQKLEVSYISPPREGSNKGDLLTIYPQELQFPLFKLVDWEDQNKCTLKLTNNTDSYVAFKVKTTNSQKFSVSPNLGIVLPNSSHDVKVLNMKAQVEAPTNMECNDKFLIQSVIASPAIASPRTTREDIHNDMFRKGSGKIVQQKVKVSYISPPQPPSILQDGWKKGNLLSIHPQQLQFPFELNNLISWNVQLTNNTDCYVAFKVYTTNPKKYCILPNYGIVEPHTTCDLIVKMEPQKEAPTNMECKDGFLIQSVITTRRFSGCSDISSDMFNKESGNFVDEYILEVSHVSPLQPPSAAQESSDDVTVFDCCDVAKLRPDSIKSLGILQNSNVSPAAQERSDEGGTVLDKGNLRSNSIINPGELLNIQPQELEIRFKLNKEMFCTMKLTNNTDSYVAFKVKTTNTKKYYVRPYIGIAMPHSTHYLLVMIQAQEEAPINMECKDTFLLLSAITSPETTEKDVMSDMFNNESANVVNEQKLKIRYVSPSQTLLAALHRMDLVKAPRSNDVEDNSSKKLMKHKKFFHSSGNLVENTMLLFKLWIFGVLVGYLVQSHIV